MALSRVACLRHLGTASKSLLLPKPKVEMSPALIRFISSSEKKPSIMARQFDMEEKGDFPNEIANPPRTAEDFAEAAKKPRNWISYGFSYEDRFEDADVYHTTMFFFFSIFLVLGTFWLAYLPDWNNQDWSLREGYFELARRERLGLPRVDKEFIPLDRIKLPTEEEIEELGVEVYL